MGAFESGQAFMAGVLAKLPEEQRAQAKAIFDAAEAKDAVVLLGDGTLARSDYSRSMDTLREKEAALNEHYESLNNWYTVNKGALDEAKVLKGGGMVTPTTPQAQPTTPQAPQASTALTPDDVRRMATEAVNDAGRDSLQVMAFIANQASRHLALFGEPLDALEIAQNPKLGRPVAGQPGRVFSLQDAYLEKYGERLQAKYQEAEDKRINDEVEKRLVERQKTQTSHPFPLRSESSPLDVLSTKEGPAAHTLDSAVAEYDRLQAARGS
jgi:hypothetical protein